MFVFGGDDGSGGGLNKCYQLLEDGSAWVPRPDMDLTFRAEGAVALSYDEEVLTWVACGEEILLLFLG